MSQNDKQQSGETLTKIQIYRHVAGSTIFDICEMLAADPKWSKLAFTLVEFDDNYKATRRVRHYVDVDDFKLVCFDLLSRAFTSFEDHKGTVHDDYIEGRVLTLRRDTKQRLPVLLRIDNGEGEVYGSGQVRMKNVTETMSVQLSDYEGRKMAVVVQDYVNQWEMIHFRQRQEARTITLPPPGEVELPKQDAPPPKQRRMVAG